MASRLTRALGVTGGTFAVVGMLAGPAQACLWSGTADSTAFRLVSDDVTDARALTLAEYQQALQATLDRLGARLAADLAQWSGVDDDAVLTPARRQAALVDLAYAQRALAKLAAVPTSGTFTPSSAQRAAITQLQAGFRSVVSTARELLANKPDVTALLQVKLDALDDRLAADTAQWGAATAPLTATQVKAAYADEAAARAALAYLAGVEARGLGTAAQQADVDALQAGFTALKTRIASLLAASVPAPVPADKGVSWSPRQAVSDDRRDGDRDRLCDRDRDGDRDGARESRYDGDRSWGDRSDGDRSWGDRDRRS